MTVRLDPAMRRKVERVAAREGVSMNEALNRLIERAPDEAPTEGRRRYRLRPRKVAFGFDIARARDLADAVADQAAREKLRGRS